ncbi:MAG TPA: hypothetical protein VE861_12045 [Gemmatimonadaceae bacterium]|nr:hypothetical protein [Gemmatimonadaceae bacterium]
MAALRSHVHVGYGAQPADGLARRYDDGAARRITRYDAPSTGGTRRLDVPAARLNRFRAPAQRIGTTYDAPAAGRRREQVA